MCVCVCDTNAQAPIKQDVWRYAVPSLHLGKKGNKLLLSFLFLFHTFLASPNCGFLFPLMTGRPPLLHYSYKLHTHTQAYS